MRQVFLAALLISSTLTLVLANYCELQTQDEEEVSLIPEKWNTAINSNKCGLDSYSPAVKAAFAQVGNMDQYDDNQLESSEGWVAVIPNSNCDLNSDWAEAVAEYMGATEIIPTTHLAHTWIIMFPSVEQATTTLSESEHIDAYYPLVVKQQSKKLIPNDTYFSEQWHLQNTGQDGGYSGEDANVTSAWDTYDGSGVTIGIVDDGLDHDHPDLSPNYQASLSYDFCSNDPDPDPGNWDGHGTSAAGVAAAVGNDGNGVTGAAMDADLAGLELISCGNTDSMEADALNYYPQSIDIYSNSWGPYDDGKRLEAPGPLMMAAFEDDIQNGRGGLGNIITWAAGNGLGSNDNSNYDGYANSRYTISVTAIHDRGSQSSYAEPGANTLVAAHSDGRDGIYTTDIVGGGGYSNGDYTDDFGGTSSATPLVSGVIALMLEANPNLTWRDVQHILVRTSTINDPSDSDWLQNAAGHDINHKYGYGTIDAHLATELAANWTTVSPEIEFISNPVTVSQSIPDGGSAITSTINVSQHIQLESVELIFDASHSYRGDLEIKLTSPQGTVSVLAEEHSDNGNDYNTWRFSTVLCWDEDAYGDWTLSVQDMDSGQSGTWNSWELHVYGTGSFVDSDMDLLSDMNETNVYGTDPQNYDTDSDGLSDGEEVLVLGTDPLSSDTDMDGLSDGEENNTYGTDPNSNDTDTDGLLDGDEINIYGSNPLIFDADADSDTWYWFWDCNDSNPQVNPGMIEALNGIDDNCSNGTDEGFNMTDLDSDDLSDFDEYHHHGTNYSNPDTDADGLDDGDEINIYGTDPLIPNIDGDLDGYYDFQDCNDSNSQVNPTATELLNGVDDDCDTLIDEDYIGLDTDGDGLLDLTEFNQFGTDPFDPDSDGDTLIDGEEILIFFTDPLIPNLDMDADGFRDHVDCNDSNASINPAAPERWNDVDDNCNGVTNEGLIDPNSLIKDDLEITILIIPNQGVVNVSYTFSVTVNHEDDVNDDDVIWSFGDSEETKVGKSVTHIYGTTGYFEVQVCISLVDGDLCDSDNILIYYEDLPDTNDEVEANETKDTNSDNGQAEISTTEGYTVGNQEMLMFGLALVLMVLLGVLLNSKKKTPPPTLEIAGFNAARTRFELNNQNDLLPPLP